MATATAQSLSPAARDFVDRAPQLLVVGGERLEAADGRTFETIDPATGEAICEVAFAGPEDVERAVQAARAALDGPLRKVSPSKRAGLMYGLAELIKANGDELAELESLDNGKPLASARGDIAATVNHLRYYAGWPTKIEGETIPVSARNVLCYTLREPVGVCAQIVPWNFPLLMAVWKVAPALAAGCSIVLKPAEQTPLTALRLGELALEAGFPEGTLNVLTGDGTTGAALVDSAGVDKVAFTGSTAVGREIGEKCGRSLKRVTLELGGKSPNIILPDADLDRAVPGSYQGIYFNSGQACNAGSRLYVASELFDQVVEQLAGYAREAKVGPGLDPETEFGPLVSEEQLERVKGYIDSGVEEGAELVVGGNSATAQLAMAAATSSRPPCSPGSRTRCGSPARRSSARSWSRCRSRTSRRWPAAPTTPNTASPRGCGRATSPMPTSWPAMLQAGNVYVNTWGGGDPAAPFGGYKSSGIGREKGHANLDAYLETKTVWVQL